MLFLCEIISVDPACEKLVLPTCDNAGYANIRLPNVFGHSNQNKVRREMKRWAPILQTGCSEDLNDFVCRVYAPPCQVSKLPCRYITKNLFDSLIRQLTLYSKM